MFIIMLNKYIPYLNTRPLSISPASFTSQICNSNLFLINVQHCNDVFVFFTLTFIILCVLNFWSFLLSRGFKICCLFWKNNQRNKTVRIHTNENNHIYVSVYPAIINCVRHTQFDLIFLNVYHLKFQGVKLIPWMC